MNLILSIFYVSNIHNDAATPWQFGFQDSASPTGEGIAELHDTIMFYLITIAVLVFWILGSLLLNFNDKTNKLTHKYLVHGTLIELVWTVTPALVLIAIAFPSFKLLYLMDLNLNINQIATDGLSKLSSLWPYKSSKNPIKSIHSKCTALVPYGKPWTIGFTLGINLNKHVGGITFFPKYVISSLVGHLIGDSALTLSWSSVVSYFVMTQTLKRFGDIWSRFLSLSHYCPRIPSLGLSRGKYFFVKLSTRSYPFFTPLFNLFYVKKDGQYVKTITYALVPYLDAVALVFWAMDDGSWTFYGFYLHTKKFSFEDTYQLVAILHYNFGLICTVQNHKNKLVIYVTANSLPLFIALVQPPFSQRLNI